jgi:hypothetical protein
MGAETDEAARIIDRLLVLLAGMRKGVDTYLYNAEAQAIGWLRKNTTDDTVLSVYTRDRMGSL